MKKHKPLSDEEGEIRELGLDDMKRFEPIREAGLPDSLLKKLGVRGPQKAPTKVRVSLRLSREVVEYFRATGDGWQTRMDSELLAMVHKRKAS
jgi:uncharacterized protein (DUF4415 family)